ncbi:MAG: sigma-54-dependent Fis family transcriptional regulator [Oligoflexia bacterium]|nr:sigma-54-dependent Fis family transcriptional regulator [Oligoflexia bacterium]
MQKSTILIVDDEVNIRQTLKMTLIEHDYQNVYLAKEASEAMSILCERKIDLALIDIKLGPEEDAKDYVDGIQLFRKMKQEGLNTTVVFMSGNASLSDAARTIKEGAYDFLEKPISVEKLLVTIDKALENKTVLKQMSKLKKLFDDEYNGLPLIGENKIFLKLKQTIMQIAPTDSTVLIQGESGTGKELLAQMIHQNSGRKNSPFVKVNCSAIPETLVESEFFGYVKGAFSGAYTNKSGFFEEANHGTIFLDEIGDMSLSAQSKLLRCLNNQEIQKIGSTTTIKIDVRVISATHRDLQKMVEEKLFREDLFYRINVIPIVSPPLRERSDDIAALFTFFAHNCCKKYELSLKAISSEVINILKRYPWPGNVRELKNIVERMVILAQDTIDIGDIPQDIYQRAMIKLQPQQESQQESQQELQLPQESQQESQQEAGQTLKNFKDASERKFLINILKQTNGNITSAAKVLDIERSLLHRKITQFNIKKAEYF